jgi:hypothetical protein
MFPKAIKETDIRYNYDLGGGALMDMGCKYTFYQYLLHINHLFGRLHDKLYPISDIFRTIIHSILPL